MATVLRRCGIVSAAAQVVNAVRGVGISRMLRRKLRRARRASTRRKRAAEARQAQKQAEKRAATQRARAEADAKSARKRTRAPLRADDSGPESNRFGVAHSRDGPRDSNWLAGEYEENVPVHVEREIAAALDEVAMALAAEGDTDASAAVAAWRPRCRRRVPQEDPARGAREPLEHASPNLGSNRLVATERVREESTAGGPIVSFAANAAAFALSAPRCPLGSSGGSPLPSGAHRYRRPRRRAERSPAIAFAFRGHREPSPLESTATESRGRPPPSPEPRPHRRPHHPEGPTSDARRRPSR